jgi:hypothetical protein
MPAKVAPLPSKRKVRNHADFYKRVVALVMKQVFRNRVVREQDVHPTIMIVVGDSHAPSLARLVDTRLVRYLGELAVAIVAIKENRRGKPQQGAVCAICCAPTGGTRLVASAALGKNLPYSERRMQSIP